MKMSLFKSRLVATVLLVVFAAPCGARMQYNSKTAAAVDNVKTASVASLRRESGSEAVKLSATIENTVKRRPVGRRQHCDIRSEPVFRSKGIPGLASEYSGSRIPVMAPWAKYYGGGDMDEALGVAADANGNVVITGSTSSVDFPVTGSSAYSGGPRDAFVVKFNRSGLVQWAALFGGSGSDAGAGICCDASGNILITGTSNSADLPVTDSSSYSGGEDAFTAKFDGDGVLLWAGFFGGSGNDRPSGIAVDAAGNAVFTGESESADFLVTDSSSNAGGWDAFVVKLDGKGNMLWATCYGGSAGDRDSDVAVDGSGNAIIAGTTYSTDLNVTDGSRHAGGLCDQFIVKYDSGGEIVWAMYFGGGNQDRAYSISTCDDGAFVVCGDTRSTNIPVTNSSTNAGGNADALAAKFSGDGTLLWATYYGGSGYDTAHGAATDEQGNAVIAGRTQSKDLIVTDSSSHNDGVDVFVVKFNDTGGIIRAKYYGGSLGDHLNDVALNTDAEIVIAGNTESVDFHVTDASTNSGLQDAFVVCFNPDGTVTGLTAGTSVSCLRMNVFPNPAKDLITIHRASPSRAPARIAVYSMLGNEIAEIRLLPGDEHTVSMNTASFSPGFYLIEFRSDGERICRRLLIER